MRRGREGIDDNRRLLSLELIVTLAEPSWRYRHRTAQRRLPHLGSHDRHHLNTVGTQEAARRANSLFMTNCAFIRGFAIFS
jgi:hypothetical protein